MTKKLTIVLVVLFLTGCSFSIKDSNNSTSKKVEEKQISDYADPYVDDNPILLGLYQNESGTRNLITSYESNFDQYRDIVSLEVYYTKDQTFIGNQKDLFSHYYQNYQDIDSYKIGYHISFEIGNDKISQTILRPSDVNSFFDYVQIYLYDDIHQESGWYDHVSEEEVMDTTLFTSIKLTASTKIADVTSPITLTAFTYDSEDIDEFGNYKGKSSYQVTIQRS